MLKNTNQKKRPAAVVVFVAILLIPLLGMMAFSIDTGYMCLAKTELQNAVDAATMAASEAMQPFFVQYYLPGQTNQSTVVANAQTAARVAAKKYASANKVGNVPV